MPDPAGEDARRRAQLNEEFNRTAPIFDRRTRGRFDEFDVPGFSRLAGGETVLEVGSGTGAFLSLFEGIGGRLIGVDLTPGMLLEARRHRPAIQLILADGRRMPVRSRSIDLVASAQTFHHIQGPLPILGEMRRVMKEDGRVLILDQVATEHFEEAVAMNELEIVRDPTHAASRPPSAFRVLVQAAGLGIVDERIVTTEQRMSGWMAPGEFPAERFDAVRAFIEKRGHETGMNFRRDGDDYIFERRRMLILAERR